MLEKPIRKGKVFDLVEEAGFDTSDWILSARNCPAKANPKYCYEWAFVEHGKVVILSLWHDMLSEEQNSIVHRENFRADASGNLGKPTWVRRATRLDEALQVAIGENLPIRVIVNDGVRRRRGDPSSTPSHVSARELDTATWTIAAYDHKTGDHVLRRGQP